MGIPWLTGFLFWSLVFALVFFCATIIMYQARRVTRKRIMRSGCESRNDIASRNLHNDIGCIASGFSRNGAQRPTVEDKE